MGNIQEKPFFDMEKVEKLKKYKIYLRKDGYPATKINGETILVHKILTNTIGSGKISLKIVVDHINGNRADNRMSNLRIVSQSINIVNKHDSNFVGISFHSNRSNKMCWRSYIRTSNGNLISWFYTKKEAIIDRLNKEISIYGSIVSNVNKKWEYLLNHSSNEGEA